MSTVITARAFGPRPLSELETQLLFHDRMVEQMHESSESSIEYWKSTARSSRRTGNYIRSIGIITFNYAPRSVQIEVGSTLKYARYLEEGRGPQVAIGKSFGTGHSDAKYPWPDRKGGGTRGQVYAHSVGPAAPRRFRDRVLLHGEPMLRAEVRLAARKIRDQIVAEMNAKAVLP